MTSSPNVRQPIRILAVAAHPDDIDVNAGGTISKWVKSGAEVSYLVVTSGDAGGDGSVSRQEISSTRRREQIASAQLLGVSDVRFLEGYLDGRIQVTDGLVCDIVRVIRQLRPHRVLAMSPERDWLRIHQGHPDHLAVGEATVQAVYPASRNPFAFPELLDVESLAAWSVAELWLQAHPHPNHHEDITEEFDLKEQALRMHVSQFSDPEMIGNVLRRRHLLDAETVGLAPGRLVESFLRVDA